MLCESFTCWRSLTLGFCHLSVTAAQRARRAQRTASSGARCKGGAAAAAAAAKVDVRCVLVRTACWWKMAAFRLTSTE
jgi:hypothetical protein